MSIDPEYFKPICEDCTPGPLGSTICDPSDPDRTHCPYRVPDDDEPTTPLTHRYPDAEAVA